MKNVQDLMNNIRDAFQENNRVQLVTKLKTFQKYLDKSFISNHNFVPQNVKDKSGELINDIDEMINNINESSNVETYYKEFRDYMEHFSKYTLVPYVKNYSDKNAPN